MSKLAEIPHVNDKLKSSSTKSVKALHKLVFEEDGDRNNRKRLREFKAWTFDLTSDDYTKKLEYCAENLTAAEVVGVCTVLGLDYSETKDELLVKICAALMDFSLLTIETASEDDENEQNDDDIFHNNDNEESLANEDSNSEDERQSVTARANADANVRQEPKMMHFAMSFKDIEETIRTFDGSSGYPVKQWLIEFEDTAMIFGWNDLQKVVYAKRSLKGLAKMFIQSEGVIRSYKEFKRALIREFHKSVNSAHLHEKLNSRKIKKEESLQEFFLAMRTIATSGNIEDEALMTYVINGISDEEVNKIPLYGAKSIQEFKERLRVYENIYKKTSQVNKTKNKPDQKNESTAKSVGASKYKTEAKTGVPIKGRCFNCGGVGHKSSECKHKAKGYKCFNCNEFGHRATECTADKKDDRSGNSNIVSRISARPLGNMHKKLLIEGSEVDALVDTGSEINVIREDIYKRIGSPKLRNSDVVLTGLGNSKINPIGYFNGTIQVDGHDFVCKIFTVSNNMIRDEAIIGNELLKNAEIMIGRDGVSIRKVDVESIDSESFLMNINTVDETSLNTDICASQADKIEVETLIKAYKPNKTENTNIEMIISVKEAQPIFHRPRRLPFPERQIVDDQVKEWLENRIIEPSTSEYSSQVIVVYKKDGSPRVCIDFRAINRIMVKDRYPLPLIEDVLDRLQEARVFSTLDLKNGFFHVGVHKDSKQYTSFVTHNGQFQFLRVPFGQCNAPSVFQRFINTVFRELINKGIVLPYMDDVIIPAADEQEGIERLKWVFKVASSHGMEINFKKCQFLKREVEFLGHVIKEGKISPSVLTTKAVMRFPEPKTIKSVESFLGLTGYFRKFIASYSIIAKPLSDLRKKGSKFEFGDAQRGAFYEMKKILSEKPVLGIYNQKYETELHTDASIDGYGAVLLQKSPIDLLLHPIYFMSKKTTDVERKYSSYQLEVLAIIEALKKFRIYLLGIKFKIVTDCSAFQKTMSKKELTTKVARWALLLEDYDYEIVHRSGTRMAHVDALSRNPVMIIQADSVMLKIKVAQQEDSEIKAIMEVLKTKPYDDYCDRGGVIYKFLDGREVLVVPEAMQLEIIQRAHGDGHLSRKRTKDLLKQNYYIPKLQQKVEKCLANCVHCILVNRKSGKQEGILHPLNKEDVPLFAYHVDHLGPLESTNKNYKHIFAVIDGFSKFVWLYPTKSTTAAEAISKLDQQKSVFGNPVQITSDKGSAFRGNEFQDYCAEENIKHMQITTGLPRANGQVERLNSVLISVLAKLSLDDPSKWFKHVNKLQQVVNSSYHRSINTTPFELLFGTKMNVKEDIKIRELLEEEFREIFQESRDDLRIEAKKQIAKVQEENKKTFNKKRKDATKYKVGDLVAIKRTQFGPGLKLKPKFLGPYSITKVKGNDTYDVVKEGMCEGSQQTSTCAVHETMD